MDPSVSVNLSSPPTLWKATLSTAVLIAAFLARQHEMRVSVQLLIWFAAGAP
jgi:hypothetical protein